MRIVNLSTFDVIGGAARAAYRIHSCLVDFGIDSTMLVRHTGMLESAATSIKTRFGKIGGTKSLFEANLDKLPLTLHRYREKEKPWSIGWFPTGIASQVKQLNPDIVHLNWVGQGFVPIRSLPRFERPLVWTFHDSWAFTGGCHLPAGCIKYRQMCGTCPQLRSEREYDLSRQIWGQKHQAWQDVPLTVVTPSRWLADCAKSSSLLRNTRIEIIPHGLNLNIYKPLGQIIARKLLDLPYDKQYILFGAVSGTKDDNKGFHLLIPATKRLAAEGWIDKAEIIVFGAREPKGPPDLGLKVHYLGYLYDELSLSILYSAADVFVIPSLQENLPNTVMEALACGTPCVGFNVGGIPELIEGQYTGYLAKPYEIEDLAHGIAWVLEDRERWNQLSLQARVKVERDYNIENIARKYLSLYEELLSSSY